MTPTRPTRVGIIEVGSRAVRLLVADVAADRVELVRSRGFQTHLAAAEHRGREAVTAALRAVRSAMDEAQAVAAEEGVKSVYRYGTEAVRTLMGSGYELPASLGLTVLTPEAEARASLIAGVYSLPEVLERVGGDMVMVMDQGAGSLEVARGHDGTGDLELVDAFSMPLGTERMVEQMRRSKGDFTAVRAFADGILGGVVGDRDLSSSEVIGFGGGLTKFVWIEGKATGQLHGRYASPKIHGRTLVRDKLEGLYQALVDDPRAAMGYLRQLSRMSDPRDDHVREAERLAAGLLASLSVLTAAKADIVTVSGWGARFGVAWLYANHPEALVEWDPPGAAPDAPPAFGGKYGPIGEWLAGQEGETLDLPLATMEEVLGFGLPASYRQSSYWRRKNNAVAVVIAAAGWAIDELREEDAVLTLSRSRVDAGH